MKKHPQFILAIAKEAFAYLRMLSQAPIVTVMSDAFIEEAQSHVTIRERHWLDGNGTTHRGDTNYRQVLPYTAIAKTGRGGRTYYGLYQRMQTVGEERLAGKVSIGFGGHVDFLDIRADEKSVIDLFATIEHSRMREMDEELDVGEDTLTDVLEPTESDGRLTLILDDSDAVGQLHVAFFRTLYLHPETQCSTKEEELTWLGFFTADEILEMGVSENNPHGLVIENWSKLLLEHFVAQRAKQVQG